MKGLQELTSLLDDRELEIDLNQNVDDDSLGDITVPDLDSDDDDKNIIEDQPGAIDDVPAGLGVKDIYSMLRDYDIVPELEEDNIEEDVIRNHIKTLGESKVTDYFETRPERFRDMFKYQAALENPTDEDLDKFYQEYLKPAEPPVTFNDIEDNVSAKDFLKNYPGFTELYDDVETMEAAFDVLEDQNKLVSVAQKLQNKEKQAFAESEAERAAAAKETIAKAEREKALNRQKEIEFNKNLQKELQAMNWQDIQKQKAIHEINPKNISEKWSKIISDPKALLQFGNILSYFDTEKGFDDLYAILEGKVKSRQISKKEEEIAKDSFGKLLGRTKKVQLAGDLSSL